VKNDLCLVSPQDISREGLHKILCSDGFNIICSVADVTDLIDKKIDPNFLVVIDISNPNAQLEAVEKVTVAYPSSAVVVISEIFDMGTMVKCFELGAKGYIIKSIKSEPLSTALKLVSLGEKVLPSALVDALVGDKMGPALGHLDHHMDDANLSARERDVLCCLMAGYSNKVIARELDVCEATVKVHVKAILRKLDVQNRTQAAIWAKSRGVSGIEMLDQRATENAAS
jgi:two-component system nitrate/nitrite response regulator NarL